MKAWLERRWYEPRPPPRALDWLSQLYGAVAAARRRQLGAGQIPLPVPVIVVGNISVGGTGKTPFTIWLVQRLREWGFRPGVISRGYGGRAPAYPLRVELHTDPAHSGDEPLLIRLRTGAPVAVAPDRVAAAQRLLAETDVDVLVSDDGLQHYRLPRQIEICVVDGRRGLGNGALLPAGPLREPPQRLREVQLVVVNGGGFTSPGLPIVDMQLQQGEAINLMEPSMRQPLPEFAAEPVHAVAGIGDPERFFAGLEAAGLRLLRHAFADHHAFIAADLAFADTHAVLMTEKDAVKCRGFADARCWSVPVDAVMTANARARVRELVQTLRPLAASSK